VLTLDRGRLHETSVLADKPVSVMREAPFLPLG